MRVALLTTFAASRKDPLGDIVARIHQAFLSAGIGDPSIWFLFVDGMLPGGVSSVDRVLKRYPDLAPLLADAIQRGGIHLGRRISNDATGQPITFATLQAIAAGAPRSFPFHIPVTARATPIGQYPMGDAEQWRTIVENLGALVAELDRTLVPEVEALVGPTPERVSALTATASL